MQIYVMHPNQQSAITNRPGAFVQAVSFGAYGMNAQGAADCIQEGLGFKKGKYSPGADKTVDALVQQAQQGGHSTWTPNCGTCVDPTLPAPMKAACAAVGYDSLSADLMDLYKQAKCKVDPSSCPAPDNGGGGGDDTPAHTQRGGGNGMLIAAAAAAALIIFWK